MSRKSSKERQGTLNISDVGLIADLVNGGGWGKSFSPDMARLKMILRLVSFYLDIRKHVSVFLSELKQLQAIAGAIMGSHPK